MRQIFSLHDLIEMDVEMGAKRCAETGLKKNGICI